MNYTVRERPYNSFRASALGSDNPGKPLLSNFVDQDIAQFPRRRIHLPYVKEPVPGASEEHILFCSREGLLKDHPPDYVLELMVSPGDYALVESKCADTCHKAQEKKGQHDSESPDSAGTEGGKLTVLPQAHQGQQGAAKSSYGDRLGYGIRKLV